MKMKKQNKGITLIALVITVIVLLILAGAAVSIGLNEEDVFNRANQAKTEWNSKVAEENDALDRYKSYLENDPNKIAITATQNGGVVQFSVNVPGNKSVEEATQEEKLEAILDEIKSEGAPENMTIQDLKNGLRIFTYEEEIENAIEALEIATSDEDTEVKQLNKILDKWKESGFCSEEDTIDDVRQVFQRLEADNENTINSELERLEISSIGEPATIMVKYGEEPIEVYGKKFFYPSEEGTYTITASTQSGKHGETTINVDYGGLTALVISQYAGDEPLTVLYDATKIRTWDEFVNSEYNTIGMYWQSYGSYGYYEMNGSYSCLGLNSVAVGQFDDIVMGVCYGMLSRVN